MPYNPTNLRNRRFGAVLVSLAGPASNFVLALAAVVAVRILYPTAETAFDIPFSLRLLDIVVAMNVILGVFNLLPIPPLDGSSLLALVLPPSRQSIVGFLDQYGIFLLLGLLILAPTSSPPCSARSPRRSTAWSASRSADHRAPVGGPGSGPWETAGGVGIGGSSAGSLSPTPDAGYHRPAAPNSPAAAVPPHQRIDSTMRR